MNPKLLLLPLAGCALFTTLLLAHEERNAPITPSDEAPKTVALAEEPLTRAPTSADEVRPDPARREPSDEAILAEPSREVSEAEVRERQAMDSCRSAIELSLSGILDPAAIFALAESLTQCPVDPRAIPDPSPSGGLRFPLLETPEGVQAELKVERSNNPRFAHILGLTMNFPASEEGRFLEGSWRQEPSASVQVWTDADGHPLDVTVWTSMKTDYAAMRSAGLAFEFGTFPEGVLYHCDLEHPESASLRAFGMVEGRPADWQLPLLLDGGAWRPSEQTEQFSNALLSMHNQVKSR
jgi:hypothetical protein